MTTLKIKNLELGIEKVNEEAYEKFKREYIASHTEWIPGYSTGFMGWRDGRHEKRPDIGEIEWNQKYPRGYKDWFDTLHIPATFALETKDKINEIIDFINKQK